MAFVRYNVPVMIRRVAQQRRPRYVNRRRQATRRRPAAKPSPRALPSASQMLSGVQGFLSSPGGRALLGLASSYISARTGLPMLPPPRE